MVYKKIIKYSHTYFSTAQYLKSTGKCNKKFKINRSNIITSKKKLKNDKKFSI